VVLLSRHQIFCGLDRERLLQNLPTPEIRLHRCCFADVVLAFTDQFGRVLQHSGEIGERLRCVLGDLTATLFGSCRSVVPSTAQRAPVSVTLHYVPGKPSVYHLRAARTAPVTLRKLRANLRFTIGPVRCASGHVVTTLLETALSRSVSICFAISGRPPSAFPSFSFQYF